MIVGVSAIALLVGMGVAVALAVGVADTIGPEGGETTGCAMVSRPDNNSAPAIVAITIALSASPSSNCFNRL